jgi:hypothetical protein
VKRCSMSNQPEESFLQKNFEYYQAWHHWLRKAVKLKRAALILYRADLPDLRLYDKAYKKAEKEVGQEGKALIRHRHPDMLPAFSMFGSALESLFKGLMVSKSPGLIGAHKLSPSLKSHDLVQLSKDAGVKLNAPETRLLGWLSEVVIWKARYSVPTNTKFGAAFFHRLDNTSLADAQACIKILETIFARTKKALPKEKRISDGFDLLIAWKE